MWLPGGFQIVPIREALGGLHKMTGLFSDPSLDIKAIVNDWSAEGMDCEVDVEERGFLFDPHM